MCPESPWKELESRALWRESVFAASSGALDRDPSGGKTSNSPCFGRPDASTGGRRLARLPGRKEIRKNMRRPSLCLAVAALALPITPACGSTETLEDCVSICEAQQSDECTNVVDCKQTCDAGSTLAEQAQCQNEYEAYSECQLAQIEDACLAVTECGELLRKFGECTTTFCIENLDSPECRIMAQSF
jgi:hypothetical protein